jgi:diguanylate cyclase (GGDEF)-like protein
MRGFVARLTPASTVVGSQSLPGSLVDIARPGSGARASAAPAPARTASSPTAGASGSSQVNVLANRVRAIATGASSTATSTPARISSPTDTTRPARAKSPAPKHAPAHRSSRHSDPTFLLPLGVPAPLEHFVNRVPEALWIALASALALAGVGGVAALGAARRVRRQAGEYAAVAAVALTDPLTGILNRRGFSDVADRELARARRYQTPFVLAYVDVRGLKTVNDSEGHLAGDAVIRQVARLLSDSIRAEDAVGRLGGDELALLLTGQSATGADAVIERIQARVPASRAELGLNTSWDVTIGTASFPADGATFEELVDTADRRLYEQRGIQLR